MKSIRRCLSSIALLALLSGTAQPARAQDDAPRDVVIGEEHTVFSKTLNEKRRIFISKPGDYDKGDMRYPVMFMLDGRNPFYYTSGLARFLAANDIIPDLLIVSVDNPEASRTRDLTPLAMNPRPETMEAKGGGSARFRSFIADELMPWVEKNYRTRPYKMLIGHSLGGLFVIDTLTTQPELFNSYIAISPSLWWDSERLVERAETFFASTPHVNATLFMTTAEYDAPNLRGSVKKLAGVLDKKAPAGFEWRFESLPLETHGSVAVRSVYEGLEFVFADWRVRDPLRTYNLYGIEALEHAYQRRRTKYGNDDREAMSQDLRIILQALLAARRLDELTTLLARYRDSMPTPPPRIFEEIAAGYRAQGRADRAIEFYRQALKADSTRETARKALAELGADASDAFGQ